MMKRISLLLTLMVLGAFGVAVVSLTAQAQEKPEGKRMVVVLKDGRTFEGVVTQKDTGVDVETNKGVLTFGKEEIDSIEEPIAPKDAYIVRKSKIDVKDPQALYELAEWVWKRYPDDPAMLELAMSDLEAVLKLDESHARAGLLRRQVEAKLRLLQRPSAPVRPAGPPKEIREEDFVTQRDLLWIRLEELRPSDAVTINYKNDAMKRYIDSIRGSRVDGWDRQGKETQFLKLSRTRQVAEILQNRRDDIELLQDIHVIHDPKFMTDFRTKVWPIIEKNCASAACHGGPEPKGGLKFFVVPGSDPRVLYTNFLIVSGWRKGGARLLDRQDVDASLILQYGLNRKVAKKTHPVEIPPVFTSIRANNYRIVRAWMDSLKKPMAPNYHIHAGYRPAGMALDTSGAPELPEESAGSAEKKEAPAPVDEEDDVESGP